MHEISSYKSIINTVIGGLILAAILWLIPETWFWLKNIFITIRTHLSAFSDVRNWVLYGLGFFAGVTLLHLFTKFFQRLFPTFKNYKKDVFLDSVWRWEYGHKDKLIGINGFCKECDTELVWDENSNHNNQIFTTLQCERCNEPKLVELMEANELTEKVRKLIERKIRNGEWKLAIKTLS